MTRVSWALLAAFSLTLASTTAHGQERAVRVRRALLVDRHLATHDGGEAGTIQTFAPVPYRDELYHWGGAVEGFVFRSNGELAHYVNVGCSEETNPEISLGERWTLSSDGVITVTGPNAIVRYRIEALSRERLVLRVLELVISPRRG